MVEHRWHRRVTTGVDVFLIPSFGGAIPAKLRNVSLRGIGMMNAVRRGQARWVLKGGIVSQTRLIHRLFGLAA